jgi:hypothetical protein
MKVNTESFMEADMDTIALFAQHRSTVLVLLLLTLVIAVSGVTRSEAQGLVQPDGRINQVTHFGGDALYCVDRNFVATNQYSDFGQGGFRLLDSKGQELWFVPAADVAAAVAEAKETGKGVLVASGRGTYGPVTIHTYVTGEGDDYFVFSGYDEYGKPNSLTFKFCIPVGPIPERPGDGDSEGLCTLLLLQKPFAGKVIMPLLFGSPARTIPIDCDLCPNNPNNDSQKRAAFRPLSGRIEGECLEFIR